MQIGVGWVLILGGVFPVMAGEPQRWQFSDDRLENGLRVLTMEDRRTPLVNAQVWYHVGSKDENPQRQGFAHMFEHMMFRGTDRVGPQDHFKYLQRYGGQVNGYTSFDMTVYWQTVPASQLDLALWLEAERMANLKINEDYFAAEREVVKEERRMRYLNRPYGKLPETVFGAAYRVHPYRWTPIGNMQHLNAATAEELRAFFKTYYTPNNATLVVVGDVRRDELLAKARKYFGPIRRGPEVPVVKITEPPLEGARRVEITDRAPSPMVVFAYRAPSARDPDSIPLEVLGRVLTSGQSSRLYRELVQGQQIAVNATAEEDLLEQGGLFFLSVVLRPQVSVENGEAALLGEVRRLLDEGLKPEELAKAKNQALAEYVRKGETVQGRADQLGYATVILDDPQRVNTDLDRTRAVTAEQVLAAAKRVLREDSRVTVIVRPDPNPPPAEEAQDKSTKASEKLAELPVPEGMPTGQPPRPVDLPFPSIRRLANGLQTVVFTDHSLPAVTVSFNALIGAKDDPSNQPGVASVTASTLRRGTKKHTGDELAELIDFHAMSLSESVEHNATSLSLWTLAEHLGLAAETLAEIVREPIFPEREVANYASRASAQASIAERDPSTVATRVLDHLLYGDNYLGRPSRGTSASLKTITRAEVEAFHQRYFAPDIATLLFAGDVEADRACELAERWFGNWQGKAGRTTSPPPPASAPLHVVLKNHEGATQSELRIGQVVSVSRHDPDYPAARLLSYIFGESFTSRLNRVLRIEKGLTYGSHGYFDVEAESAALKISTFTRTDKTVEAIQAARREVERLSQANPTRQELEEGRDALIGRFQMGLETPAQIAARYWDLIVWGLPERWYSNYLRSISKLQDPAELVKVAKAKLDPSRLTIVVVGNATALQPALEKLGPLEVAGD